MVERIAPFGARGVLWYQGEEIPVCNDYAVLLHCMINQWRRATGARTCRLLLRNFRNL